MYGTSSLAGLAFFFLGVRRHGLSQPFGLAIAAIMLVLSLVWLVMTLRSRSPLSSRGFGVRSIILLVLLMAHEISSI
jgi:hypothetical protein